MASELQFTLAYLGRSADRHRLDFYDVSQALIGFQRSLALTTHLALNGEIITHAPALKGARIYASPPEEGSWKIVGVITIAASTAIYNIGTADRNTPLGHIVYSLYDYVVSESLGVHVNYEKSLGQLYEEARQKKKSDGAPLRQSQADSLIEKCHRAIEDMHRPIYASGTAVKGVIESVIAGKSRPLKTQLTGETYEFIHETYRSDQPEEFLGRITSYNSNTYKGRIYLPDVGRPLPFELSTSTRNKRTFRLITTSLRASALRDRTDQYAFVKVSAYVNKSRTGQLKWLTVTHVEPAEAP